MTLIVILIVCLFPLSTLANSEVLLPYSVKKSGEHYSGFLDADGNWVIEPRFESVSFFSEGLAAARKDGSWGFINRIGEWVIKPEFDSAWDFKDGFSVVGRNDSFKIINAHGNKLHGCPLYQSNGFYSGLSRIKINDLWGFIDKSCQVVIKPKYTDAFNFVEGLASVKNKGYWGVINEKGEWVIRPIFQLGLHYYEGKAVAKAQDKYGLINTQGQWLIKPQYDSLNLWRGAEYLTAQIFDKTSWHLSKETRKHNVISSTVIKYISQNSSIEDFSKYYSDLNCTSITDKEVKCKEKGRDIYFAIREQINLKKSGLLDFEGNWVSDKNCWVVISRSLCIRPKSVGFTLYDLNLNQDIGRVYKFISNDSDKFFSANDFGDFITYIDSNDEQLISRDAVKCGNTDSSFEEYLINRKGETIWPLNTESAIPSCDELREIY